MMRLVNPDGNRNPFVSGVLLSGPRLPILLSTDPTPESSEFWWHPDIIGPAENANIDAQLCFNSRRRLSFSATWFFADIAVMIDYSDF
jgi:hypothetical protein